MTLDHLHKAANEALTAIETLAEFVVTHKLTTPPALKPAIERYFENVWFVVITSLTDVRS